MAVAFAEAFAGFLAGALVAASFFEAAASVGAFAVALAGAALVDAALVGLAAAVLRAGAAGCLPRLAAGCSASSSALRLLVRVCVVAAFSAALILELTLDAVAGTAAATAFFGGIVDWMEEVRWIEVLNLVYGFGGAEYASRVKLAIVTLPVHSTQRVGWRKVEDARDLEK